MTHDALLVDLPTVACVVLVDRRGWLLLQERDEHAPVDPDLWSWVGGGVEPGESPTGAAHRELAEETGLRVDHLEEVWDERRWCEAHARDERFVLFAAATGAGDADVVCGEGRQIVFVDPGAVGGLDRTDYLTRTIGPFLASATYHRLATRP